jgi:hypothetical protein
LVFVIALAVLVFLPNAESRILQIVKSAGLVLTLFRGLLGYYDDYVKMLEERGKPKTGSAKADSIYTFAGNTFVLVQGVYTQTDRITGNFVLPSSFVPSIFGAGLNNPFAPVSYSFTDGYQTLTQYNSTATFEASASSNGTLGFTSVNGSWLVAIQTPASGIFIRADGDLGYAGMDGWCWAVRLASLWRLRLLF